MATIDGQYWYCSEYDFFLRVRPIPLGIDQKPQTSSALASHSQVEG